MPPITAESLLTDLSRQMDSFICFLQIDLSPVILGGPGQGASDRASAPIATGGNTHCWIQRLREIHHWTNLALWEENWIEISGGSKPEPCLGSHRLGTIATFIRHAGLDDDPKTTKAIQLGRKLLRFECELGYGITLLFIPVLPAFRRLPLVEEARTMEILRDGAFENVRHQAQKLARLRVQYQRIYGLYHGKTNSQIVCIFKLNSDQHQYRQAHFATRWLNRFS